jgi:hypothetical protein
MNGPELYRPAIALALLIALFAAGAEAQAGIGTYRNARFGYSISYPREWLKPQGESDNGDGQIFTGEGSEMRVFGSYSLLNGTLQNEYRQLLSAKGPSVTYKTIKPTFFAISGKEYGRIYYQKTIAKPGGIFVTFTMVYDESKRSVYDGAISAMVRSFH